MKDLEKAIGSKLSPLFFKRNFGTATKSEIESLIFNLYVQDKKQKGDDYSDRQLSRELGISEAKVRNLKRTSYARYEEEIDFKKLLFDLVDKNSDIMFFEVFPNGQEVLCRIIVKEVVYYEELRAQLTKSNITLHKTPGSNYFELSLASAISFFDQNPIEEENEELSCLIDKMKNAHFRTDVSTIISNFSDDVPFGKTLKAIGCLITNKM
jgi:hypothetical protein